MCDLCWPTWRPSRSVVRRSSELSMARCRTGPSLVTREQTTTFAGPRERHRRCPEKVRGPLDCPCARGCVGIASRVPAANPRRRALRQKRAHDGRTPSYWPYDQVVTECLILRPRAMQVINCASWHGQLRRQAVARRDSMAASTPNSHETSKNQVGCEELGRATQEPR